MTVFQNISPNIVGYRSLSSCCRINAGGLSSSIPSQASSSPAMMMTPLGDDYQPGPYDVIVHGGSTIPPRRRSSRNRSIKKKQHTGNQRYRAVLQMAVVKYARANTKFQRWHLINQLVTCMDRLKAMFVAQDDVTQKWYQVQETLMKEIIEENLKDAYQKSLMTSKSKKARTPATAAQQQRAPSPTTVMAQLQPPQHEQQEQAQVSRRTTATTMGRRQHLSHQQFSHQRQR